jgi:hypothetical protein
LSAVVWLLLALAGAPYAQPQQPWFGTWTLDITQSTFDGPAPYRRGACVIEPWREGLKSVCDLVRVRGGVSHLEWAGRFDGQDYPVHGVEEYVTYAYSRIDDRSYDAVIKLDGRVAARARVSVSADGQTMTTVTTQGKSVTTSVYKRR